MCSRPHEVMHPTASVIRMIIGGSVDKFVGRICARRVGSSVRVRCQAHHIHTETNQISARSELCPIASAELYTGVRCFNLAVSTPLQWRHNDHDSVSNHQPHGCLLNRLFRRRSKKTSKLRVTGLCAGNSPETGEFPAQMASYAENVFIWWRHHATKHLTKSIWMV